MMLGFLLARMGVDVVVLEKHADFLRDFRGDTIHPSTLEIMYELGIAGRISKTSPPGSTPTGGTDRRAKPLPSRISRTFQLTASFSDLCRSGIF